MRGKMVVNTLGLGFKAASLSVGVQTGNGRYKICITEEEKNTLCSSPLGSPMLRNKPPVFNNRTPHAGLRIMNARVYTKSRIY
jgi:hypothetical protein